MVVMVIKKKFKQTNIEHFIKTLKRFAFLTLRVLTFYVVSSTFEKFGRIEKYLYWSTYARKLSNANQ